MAGKGVLHPLARMSSRGFATNAAVNPAPGLASNPDIKCTVLQNKMLVSSLDLCGPLSRITVAFKAGPRNEVSRNLGVSHIIRSMTGFTTKKYTWFAIVRNTQQNGVHFTCTGDREVTSFNIVAARNKINVALKYLEASVSSPAFKPWQIKDNLPRLKYEIESLTPHDKLIDHLHKACYRTGLGNSLFVSKDYIGTHTSEMLCDFYEEGFTSNRAAIVGYNVNHKDMLDFASCFELPMCEPPLGNSKYFGGEIRDQRNSYFAHIAVATEGVGINNTKQSLVHSVLQYAYGIHPNVAWGGSPSPLYKAVSAVASDAGISCLNIKYSDSGLFGFVISGSAKSAGKAAEAAIKVLKSGSVSQADVNRAKAMLKMNLLSSSENTEDLIDDMALQSLNGGVVIPGPVLAEAVDKITHGDVSEAAKKIASKKLSMVAVGDLVEVPYLDELC